MFKGSLHDDTSGFKVADLTEITRLKGELVKMTTARVHGSQYVHRIPLFEDADFSVKGTASKKIRQGDNVKLKFGVEFDPVPYTVESIIPSNDGSMSFSAKLKR